MGLKKIYDGYQSYQYLEPGKDYKAYKLVSQTARVKSSPVILDKVEEERVNEILEKYLIISSHDHTYVLPENLDELMEYFRSNRIVTGFEGLSISGLDAVIDGLLGGADLILSNHPWRWDSVIYELGMKLSDIDHQNYAIIGKTTEDIIKAHNEGKIAIIPSLEGGSMVENDLDRIEILFGFGVRVMGLVYSEANQFGSGLAEKKDGGLTKLGYEAVERMNKVGMTIDIAHAGDQTSLDIIESSTKPVICSHAGVRSLWNTKRMKPDEVLMALAEKGGVLGIEAAPHTTLTKNHRKHNLEAVMEHFEKAVELMGIDHVAFGPDTLFGDHVGLHHKFGVKFDIPEAQRSMEYEEVPFVDSLENPSEFKNIIRWLVKHGYSDSEIEKVVGQNILRVLKATWPK